MKEQQSSAPASEDQVGVFDNTLSNDQAFNFDMSEPDFFGDQGTRTSTPPPKAKGLRRVD